MVNLKIALVFVNRNPAIRFMGQNPKKKKEKTVDLTSAYLVF